jgi:3-hydroxyisobutyrate dehydrogenase-like beta-hydroxyacid dehydrogenase
MTKKIGFIGLGIMGKPMAKNLLKAGYTLYVYDIVKAAVDELAASGATSCATIREITEHCDVIVTMLPNSPQRQNGGPGGRRGCAKRASRYTDRRHELDCADGFAGDS